MLKLNNIGQCVTYNSDLGKMDVQKDIEIIIENDLIIDKDKVLKLFDKTLSINGIGEQKDLLLIKKALFLSKNKIDKKSLEILEKIKNSKSLWKDLAEINYNVLSKN